MLGHQNDRPAGLDGGAPESERWGIKALKTGLKKRVIETVWKQVEERERNLEEPFEIDFCFSLQNQSSSVRSVRVPQEPADWRSASAGVRTKSVQPGAE